MFYSDNLLFFVIQQEDTFVGSTSIDLSNVISVDKKEGSPLVAIINDSNEQANSLQVSSPAAEGHSINLNASSQYNQQKREDTESKPKLLHATAQVSSHQDALDATTSSTNSNAVSGESKSSVSDAVAPEPCIQETLENLMPICDSLNIQDTHKNSLHASKLPFSQPVYAVVPAIDSSNELKSDEEDVFLKSVEETLESIHVDTSTANMVSSNPSQDCSNTAQLDPTKQKLLKRRCKTMSFTSRDLSLDIRNDSGMYQGNLKIQVY